MEAEASQRPLADAAVRIVMRGVDKEDKATTGSQPNAPQLPLSAA
jgi:hypothetical protein